MRTVSELSGRIRQNRRMDKALIISRRGVIGLILGATLLAPLPAIAKKRKRRRDGDDDDAERALDAVKSGKAAPLSAILAEVEREIPGRVLEVEIDDEHGQLVYEIKILTPDGLYREVYVDPRSKKILKIEDM